MLAAAEHESLDIDRGDIATVGSLTARVPTLADQPDRSDDSGGLGSNTSIGLQHPLGKLHLTDSPQSPAPQRHIIKSIRLGPISVDATFAYNCGRGMIGSLTMRSVPVRYSEVVAGR